jgi:hypothetical protein
MFGRNSVFGRRNMGSGRSNVVSGRYGSTLGCGAAVSGSDGDLSGGFGFVKIYSAPDIAFLRMNDIALFKVYASTRLRIGGIAFSEIEISVSRGAGLFPFFKI